MSVGANAFNVVLGSVLLLTLTGCQREKTFPHRPVNLICPWSAGGGTDRIARKLAMELEANVGVPVNVANATGGGGVIGHTRMAEAPADGYTLGLATVEFTILQQRGLIGSSLVETVPLAVLNSDAAALFVRSDSPWATLDALVRDLQSGEERWRVSGTASGGIWHLALEGFLQKVSGLEDRVQWISINGSAPAMQELLAGGVDLVCCSLPEADALLASGKIRCLGVMSANRLAAYPDIPTFREEGTDWVLTGWRAVVLPDDTPEEVQEVWREALRRVLGGDSFPEFMKRSGFDFTPLIGESASEFLSENQVAVAAAVGALSAMDGDHRLMRFAFPLLMLGVLSGCLFVSAFKRDLRFGRHEVRWSWLLAALLLVGAFILALPTLGFLVAAMAFLLSAMLLRRHPWLSSVAVAVVVSIGVYGVFAKWLAVPLPWGIWGW